MNSVIMDLHIDCRMQFYARYLMSIEFAFQSYVINMVVVDLAEYTSQMADNSILTAVVNYVIPDNMGTNLFFGPTIAFRAENSFQLVLIPGLILPDGTVVVSRGTFLADTDGAALSIMDYIVLNYPALAPVWAN